MSATFFSLESALCRSPRIHLTCQMLFSVIPAMGSAWCSYRNGCRNDAIVQRVYSRIEKVTGIPQNNSEDFQLLRYKPGQHFRLHHDYIERQEERRLVSYKLRIYVPFVIFDY